MMVFALLLSVPTHSLAAVKFKDVNNPTQNAILEKLASMKYVSGTSATHFTPNNAVTRGEMAVFLNRAFKLEPVRAAGTFKDVPKSHKYYTEIQALYRANIVSGVNGNYLPNKAVTREELAIVFTRLLNLELTKTYAFKDIPIKHSSNAFIGALVKKEITVGFEDQTFRPKQAVTRIQFATFLYRGLYGKEPAFKNRVITSASIYHAKKISKASYREAFNNPQTVNFKLNANGSATDSNAWVYMRDLQVGYDGTDWIFFDLSDIVGLEENNTRTTTQYYRDDYEHRTPIYVNERVYFDQTIKIGSSTFYNAIRVSTKTSDRNNWDFYLIEGFGVVKAVHDNKVFWEMKSFTLR